MTFEEMYERALMGYQPEVRCLTLCYRFGFLEQDLPVGEMAELEQLVNQLNLELPESEEEDEARWTPDLLNEEP